MKVVLTADYALFVVGGLGLGLMMVVTLTDVLMRHLGRPMFGAMELVCFTSAVVIGFAIPYTSWTKGHIIVDFMLEKLSPGTVRILRIITRLMGIALFLFAGYNFISYGLDLIRTGEVSPGFRIPYYPITFGLAVSCFLQAVTLLCDLYTTVRGEA
ncbi:MAG: TRAP transporter small permease [Desulfomonile tiedjei]|nr:TRAP transporter small permease [Desulfomonile tiedjei]